MRLPARDESSNTVVIKSADPDRIRSEVEKYVDTLRSKHPEIVAAFWFGSWVSGIPTPGSDVDICLVLERSKLPFRDRIPLYLPSGFPVGLDLFPYTEDEIEGLKESHPDWHTCIMSGRRM
jgi:predicted nucleotidyltransferase